MHGFAIDQFLLDRTQPHVRTPPLFPIPLLIIIILVEMNGPKQGFKGLSSHAGFNKQKYFILSLVNQDWDHSSSRTNTIITHLTPKLRGKYIRDDAFFSFFFSFLLRVYTHRLNQLLGINDKFTWHKTIRRGSHTVFFSFF